jgi:hypothetical protein
MSLQRISEFAENQEGKVLFIADMRRSLVWLTSGSFRLGKRGGRHHF